MEQDIHQQIPLDCDPATAFAHLTCNDLLVKFFTNQAEVEPRVGGKFGVSWDPEIKPRDSTIGCRMTALAGSG
jgi:hypothetical protein